MALVVKDRVKETTTTTGTGTLTLGGAAGGFQAFSAIGDGNTTYYAIVDSATGDWEVGLGTYTASGTTLSRDTILESSNTGSAVNLAAGTKSVFATYPAEKSVFSDDLPVSGVDFDPVGTDNSTDVTLAGSYDYITISGQTITRNQVDYTTDIANTPTIPTNNNQLTNGAGYITGNQTITLSGDVSGSGTTAITVTVADDSHNHVISNVDGLQTALDGKQASGSYAVTTNNLSDLSSASTARSNLGLGSLATLSTVNASTITDNSVGAAELNVTGNGTTSQFLRSDGDGTFTWATPTDTNTTYTAGTGLTLSTTTFSVNYGTASGTACQGNDSRLSNSRQCNNSFDNAATARTNLGLGSLATLSAVGAAQITDNTVGAAELNVTGNGTTSQFLRSDGDGTFTWATPTDTNTTYSAGTGMSLSGTTFNCTITNNNQLTNGAGYVTSSGVTSVATSGGLTGGTITSTGTISISSDARPNANQYFGGSGGEYTYYDNSNALVRFYINSSEEMRLVSNGDLHADGDVIAYSTTISDERLKENIVGIDGALGKVSQLNGYTFTYKSDGKVSAGVIAQEVEKVLPEAVSEKELPLKADDGKEYKVVNYDALHGLLIEAIKELKAEIEVLKGSK